MYQHSNFQRYRSPLREVYVLQKQTCSWVGGSPEKQRAKFLFRLFCHSYIFASKPNVLPQKPTDIIPKSSHYILEEFKERISVQGYLVLRVWRIWEQ